MMCNELREKINEFQAFVHVSTAYANCNHTVVEERFYKTPLTGDSSLKLAEVLDDATLDKMTPEYVAMKMKNLFFFNENYFHST